MHIRNAETKRDRDTERGTGIRRNGEILIIVERDRKGFNNKMRHAYIQRQVERNLEEKEI